MSEIENILFVAHDIGSGRVLAPVTQACEAAGYHVSVVSAGPARTVLRDTIGASKASIPGRKELAEILTTQQPAAIVTGTSAAAALEQDTWAVARELQTPSVAIIDAAMNFSARLERSAGNMEQPDVICVVDTNSKRQLEDMNGLSARIEIVGQPHLEHVGRAVGWRRPDRKGGNDRQRRIVYFSEPVVAVPGERHPIGFDQFGVLKEALAGFHETRGIVLAIKPHPNENIDQWRAFIARLDLPPQIILSVDTRDALELMRRADGVFGMCSMALIEASLAGLPTLALQPARRYNPNPIISESTSITLETNPAALVDTTKQFARDIETSTSAKAPTNPYIGSTARVMQVITQTLTAHGINTMSANANEESR